MRKTPVDYNMKANICVDCDVSFQTVSCFCNYVLYCSEVKIDSNTALYKVISNIINMWFVFNRALNKTLVLQLVISC